MRAPTPELARENSDGEYPARGVVFCFFAQSYRTTQRVEADLTEIRHMLKCVPSLRHLQPTSMTTLCRRLELQTATANKVLTWLDRGVAVDYVVMGGPVYLVNTAAPFFAEHAGSKKDPGDELVKLLHAKANPPPEDEYNTCMDIPARLRRSSYPSNLAVGGDSSVPQKGETGKMKRSMSLELVNRPDSKAIGGLSPRAVGRSLSGGAAASPPTTPRRRSRQASRDSRSSAYGATAAAAAAAAAVAAEEAEASAEAPPDAEALRAQAALLQNSTEIVVQAAVGDMLGAHGLRGCGLGPNVQAVVGKGARLLVVPTIDAKLPPGMPKDMNLTAAAQLLMKRCA
jgi:hypothetical protein